MPRHHIDDLPEPRPPRPQPSEPVVPPVALTDVIQWPLLCGVCVVLAAWALR